MIFIFFFYNIYINIFPIDDFPRSGARGQYVDVLGQSNSVTSSKSGIPSSLFNVMPSSPPAGTGGPALFVPNHSGSYAKSAFLITLPLSLSLGTGELTPTQTKFDSPISSENLKGMVNDIGTDKYDYYRYFKRSVLLIPGFCITETRIDHPYPTKQSCEML